MLILHPAILLNSFISYNHFLVEPLGFSIFNIITSANRDNFTSSILIWMLFISFSFTIVRTSSTLLKRNGNFEHHCLVPDHREKAFNFSSLWCAVGFSYMAFIMFRYITSIPNLMRFFFYQKWMLNFVKHFFCIYWNHHMIFILHSVNVMYHTYWFGHVEPSLHPSDVSHLIMVYDHFNMLLNSTC